MKHGETYVLAITQAELECIHRAVIEACGIAPLRPKQTVLGGYGRGWFARIDDDLDRLRRNLRP